MRTSASLTLAAILSVVGCAVPASNSATLAGSDDVVHPRGFKLYPEPNISVNETCDMHRKLIFPSTGGIRAILKDDLTAPAECDYQPSSVKWTYDLELLGEDACGTRRLAGRLIAPTGHVGSIEINDHRTRRCDDKEFPIDVEETIDGVTRTFYGSAQDRVYFWSPDK